MTDLRKIWSLAQRRFGIAFTIGAALSFANAVSSIQFVLDAIEFVRAQLRDLPVVAQIMHVGAATIAAILNWWRSVLHQVLEWFHISTPNWLLDIGSAISFIIGRTVFVWLALRGEIAKADLAITRGQFDEARHDDRAEMYERSGNLEEARRHRDLAAGGNHRAVAAASELRRRSRMLPVHLALTVAVLIAFFFALRAIDTWYQAGRV